MIKPEIHKIRSLVLYPTELRARARKSAISASFRRSARQDKNGTEWKQESHCGTILSQFESHSFAAQEARND